MTAIDFNQLFPKKTASFQPIVDPSTLLMQSNEAAHETAKGQHTGQESTQAVIAQHIKMIYSSGGQDYPALQDVNLTIGTGAVHLLMGPSGSGKTTLLSILAGLLTPSEGQVTLLGQDITQLTAAKLAQFRLQNIGFIFQGFNLFPALTALENVELAFQLKGIRGPSVRKSSIGLLEQVGLGDRLHQLPQALSGGQKQRVAIARALVGDPAIIMADEPTAALDSQNGHAVINLLRVLAKENNRTVLIVTHDPRIIDVADAITHLEDGKIQDRAIL